MNRRAVSCYSYLLASALFLAGLACSDEASLWNFEQPGPQVKDVSGRGLHGHAPGCGRAPGRSGLALLLDGRHGMTVPHSPRLNGNHGFSLECWIRAETGPGPVMNILSKPGEYMLRVDPARAGGTISFFVRTEDGKWEPRARGPGLAKGKWYHLVAVWSRRAAYLWVNQKSARSVRDGKCPVTNAPLEIGGPIEGMAGFQGLIDQVRFYPHPLPYATVLRMVNGLPVRNAGEGRTNPIFDFQTDTEGWHGPGKVAVVQGALVGTLAPEEDLLVRSGLRLRAQDYPFCSIRMSASRGKRGVLLVASDKMCKEMPFRLLADGRMHWYVLPCAKLAPWVGTIDALALRIEGAEKSRIRLDTVRFGKDAHSPPDLRILSLSPEGRINALDQPVEILAWVRNFGGGSGTFAARLHASSGIEISSIPLVTEPVPGFDRMARLRWKVLARKPVAGKISLDIEQEGQGPARMERPILFAEEPEKAAIEMARARPWARAGYPRPMDFRHLWPQSVRFLEHNTALLVDFIGNKIPAAQEFKRRYPDRLVLMQVNDEPNGIWGSWHCVPEEFARKTGLKFDPEVFPMPKFRGYWLLGPRAALTRDFPAGDEQIQVPVPETKWFLHQRYGHKTPRDVLLYQLADGKPDWAHSEYASVIEAGEKTITVLRWPEKFVGQRFGYRAGRACVAPSVGAIYKLGKQGKLIKTWVPNLTRFCPADPATGMNAVTWWARHFARLWHHRIAKEEPHPDGYEFDGLNEGSSGDCNNDGVVDACVLGGINEWSLGLYDFLRQLRSGGKGWKGLGEDLILADASTAWGPRDPSVLNGCENEEFPSFSGPVLLPEGMDLYRAWVANARRPSCSYLQGRFTCDTYLDQDWALEKQRGKFYPDGLVRFSIAAACMGDGIYTYRAGSKRDVYGTLDFTELLEYPWDEYHAGREGRYNWLGLPTSPPLRITRHLGPDLLPDNIPAWQWALSVKDARTRASGPHLVTGHNQTAFIEVSVDSVDTTGLPRLGRHESGRRVIVSSPLTGQPLSPDLEYCLEFKVWARLVRPGPQGRALNTIMRVLGVALSAKEQTGTIQWFLAGPQPREVALTLRPPAAGPCRVSFLVGAEPGPAGFAELCLRQGCAEVFARPFEHGLALANGSALSSATFNLQEIGGGHRYRRFPGDQAPGVNNGRPAGGKITLPPLDGLLLTRYPHE